MATWGEMGNWTAARSIETAPYVRTTEGRVVIHVGGKVMDTKTLANFRKILFEEKERILSQTRKQVADELSVSSDDRSDENDLASVEVSQRVLFRLKDRERNMLAKINSALDRVHTGEYGECQSCGDDIGTRRLAARPFSTLCINCQEEHERRERIYA